MKKRLPSPSGARRLAVALALCAALLLCLGQTALAKSGRLLQSYTPEDCAAWSYHKTRLDYLGDPDDRRASDDFLFCGIDWDTDLDTALRTIAANTNRTMEDAGNGSYMGVRYGSPFWGLSEEECCLTLITVVPEDGGWWVECQLTPEQVEFADTREAVQFFQNVERALDAYRHGPAIYTLVVDDEEMELTDPDEMIGMWEDAVLAGRESARAYVDLNNVTLSMENDMYDGTYYMTCWLMLGPSGH